MSSVGWLATSITEAARAAGATVTAAGRHPEGAASVSPTPIWIEHAEHDPGVSAESR
jgi:hypothetical protein